MKILVTHNVSRGHDQLIGQYGFWSLLRAYLSLKRRFGAKLKIRKVS